MSRNLSDVLEELCPGVKERNANAFKRAPDTCMHGLYIHTCENPTCKAEGLAIDKERKKALGLL
jgi:hypothetical protein